MNVNDLPLLPGYINCAQHYPKFNHHLPHHFNVKNGHIFPKDEYKMVPFTNSVTYQNSEISRYQQLLAQERRKKPKKTSPFEPHYVTYDRKCLSFRGYFKLLTSDFYGKEQYIIRKVNIIYYLEDNTMTILEPPVTNSGYTQGRLVKRGLLPKPDTSGVPWHWKDLNIGVDLDIYGTTYHIYSCDAFTKEFLQCEGIDVNEPEQIPQEDKDNCNKLRNKYDFSEIEKDAFSMHEDKLQRFLQYDKKVLRFFALWDGTSDECGDIRYYKIHYYLIDNTVEIFETDENQQRKPYPFNRFLGRVQLPQAVYKVDGIKTEYYKPGDFNIGDTISVFGRNFLIYDCDHFTRRYFQDCLKKVQPIPVCVKKPPPIQIEKVIPPHVGIGQPEDTLQTCLSITPKPPKKDVTHYIENANKIFTFNKNPCRDLPK